MKYDFYDVKVRKKVSAEITDFKTYGKGTQKRYAFKGLTKDKRPLTTFVSKETWDNAKKAK